MMKNKEKRQKIEYVGVMRNEFGFYIYIMDFVISQLGSVRN